MRLAKYKQGLLNKQDGFELIEWIQIKPFEIEKQQVWLSINKLIILNLLRKVLINTISNMKMAFSLFTDTKEWNKKRD